MPKIIVRKGNSAEEKEDNFQEAMKLFKRAVDRSNILKEVKKREYFEKPGVKKRLKREAAQRLRNKKKSKKY